MTQVTSGIRSILSVPGVYELFQKIMGANAARKRFIKNYVEDYDVKTVLDIGCGPAEILEYMGKVEYYGFDISESYINNAKARFKERGHFYSKYITLSDLANLPKFDLVIMHGVLHHVDDAAAIEIMKIAYEALKEGGRLVTVDGCLVNGQNPIARYLIRKDRGQNVKTEQGYRELALSVFSDISTDIYHQSWIPYTLCYMQCRRTSEQ